MRCTIYEYPLSADTCAALPMLQGLRLFPAMVIVPMMQIAWTLFAIISGMLYFEEYMSFTGLSAAMFFTGVMVGGLSTYR